MPTALKLEGVVMGIIRTKKFSTPEEKQCCGNCRSFPKKTFYGLCGWYMVKKHSTDGIVCYAHKFREIQEREKNEG